MQNKYQFTAMARRGISFGVITCLGLSIFTAGTAEANRLVFTNEGDGNAPIDQDLDNDDQYELIFGDNLGGTIYYDQPGDFFNISADTTIGGDLSATDVNAGGNLEVVGTSDLQGNVSNTTGNLILDDDVDVTGGLDVQGGDITLQNDETISNAVDGTVEIDAANTNLTGDLDVQGGDIENSTGDVTINDNAIIVGTTDAQGDISNSTGDVTVNDALDVSGDIDAQEDIINSTGDVNIDDNLNVTGTTSLDGNTTVETGANLTVTDGTTSLGGDTTIETGADFTVTDGTSTFGGPLDVNSTSDFAGDVTLSADAQIINLRAENATTAGAPVCTDATDLGRIFYDTDIDKLFYCAETSPGTFEFISTDAAAPGTTSATFFAEWENFSMYQDGTDNIGTIRSLYDDADDRSYYYMTSRRAATQDLDLVLQWQVPENFTGFTTGANHLQFDIETVGAGAQVDLRDVQVNGADQSISDLANTAGAWATQDVDLSGATVAAGDTLTLRFTLYGDNTPSESRISNVKLNYDKQ